ncbi:Rid family detoxifying hydrolase, partial [Oscillibacter valericigenes]|nr:Rid family detoxifying hydrolase [Oscillibacter valericigenes]
MNVLSTPNAPSAIGPYSQAISVNGFLFASGQVALTPGTGEVVGTTIQEQAERCCQNIKGILDAAGLTFADVVKTTCFLADMGDFAAFNEVYGR